MRKINKVCSKALAYKNWIDGIDAMRSDYPKYNSTKSFCHDIRANLFINQLGVCAYTEIQLGVLETYTDDLWVDGKFTGTNQVQGHLDHFDPSKKKTKGWDWDNFFLVHSDINTKCKGEKKVYYILKPDSADYDPVELLEYDIDLHQFMVNRKKVLEPSKVKEIEEMIDTLGLNYDFIKQMRSEYLDNDIFPEYLTGLENLESLEVRQFFTAFEFMKRKLRSLNL